MYPIIAICIEAKGRVMPVVKPFAVVADNSGQVIDEIGASLGSKHCIPIPSGILQI